MSDKKNGFKLFYAISLAWQLGFIIVVPIAGFLFLGLWIDRKLDTAPLFLILGLITALAVTVYETYHILIPLLSDKDENKNDS